MSSGARSHTAPTSDRKPVGLPRLAEMKANGEPIVMVTAYDYPSATVAELNGRPVLLAVAARVGGARLIDNVLIRPTSTET